MVWQTVRTQAEQIVASDKALASFVVSNILNHDSLEDALIHRLAERLDNNDVSAELIRQTLQEAAASAREFSVIAQIDLLATLQRDPACNRLIEPLLYFKGYQAIQTQRLAHALYENGRKDFALYLQSRSSVVFQVDIHPAVYIGRGMMLDHGTGFVAGETARIGDQVSILHAVTLGGTGKAGCDRHPKIGNGVLIGAGAKILGNIKVGDCAKVASGSVVLKDVDAKTTVAGVPAKMVGHAQCEGEPALSMDHSIEP